MKTFKICKNRLKEAMHLPYFVVGALGVLLLCLNSEVMRDAGGKTITVIGMFLSGKGKDYYLENDIHLIRLSTTCFSDWFCIFCPAFASIGYAIVHSEENRNNTRISILTREGYLNNTLGKAVSCMFSCGIVMAAGYILYVLICFCFLPSLSEFDAQSVERYIQVEGNKNLLMYFVFKILKIMIAGMIAGSMTFLGSAFFKDRYILVFFPVLLSYSYRQIIKMLYLNMMEKGKFETGIRILDYDYFSVIRNKNDMMIRYVIIWLLLTILFGFVYFAICRKGGKSGK
ncbi:MAG: hypothetical protein IKR27_09755 [Lachnospiraceae bacterium]|nr:hypothetical protein [Lachnospiraceae bacterium]